MTLEQELDDFAQRGGGRKIIRPRQGQDFEAFKATINSLDTYANAGRLKIVSKRKEQHTGGRYIRRVTIDLTPEDWFESN
jgi:hypothetical protein